MTQGRDTSLPLELRFRYRHALGAREKYFAALSEGQALASACPTCGDAWFPPRELCPHHHRQTEPVRLTGTGRIVALTESRAHLPMTERDESAVWLLVRLDGALNAALGRLLPGSARPAVGARVQLEADAGVVGHPVQRLAFRHIGP